MRTKLLFISTFILFALAIAAQSFPNSNNVSKDVLQNITTNFKDKLIQHYDVPSAYSEVQDTVTVPDSIKSDIENPSGKLGSKITKEVKTNILIYPNPSNGTFIVNLDNKHLIQTLEVYNVVGERIVQQHQSNQVSIPNAQIGIYFVKIDDGTGIYTKKITVQ